MPKIPQKLGERSNESGQIGDPEPNLRVYRHHGMELDGNGLQANGECPFCGRGKFTVEEATGLWRCWVCPVGGGNPLTFTRALWEHSAKRSASSDSMAGVFAKDRGYLDPASLAEWGVCKSIIDGTWLVPGYTPDGRLDQVYRRIQTKSKEGEWRWNLLPTPGLWDEGKAHGLHLPVRHHDPTKTQVEIFEGCWDGMAWWEVARQTKVNGDGQYEFTGNPAASILADSIVVATPGCTAWRDEWTEMCRGKDVTLYRDNDHPRENASGGSTMAGTGNTKRVAGILAGVAKSVRWLAWGGGGFDANLPSGFDVRDWLVKGIEA